MTMRWPPADRSGASVGGNSVNRHPELSSEGLAALGLRNACDQEPIHLSGAIQPHGFLLVVELQSAISAGQITAYYQPILDISQANSGTLHGFEALARWEHPTSGLVHPAQFIGLAETTGLIDELGDVILMHALRQLQAWPDRALTMAVNLSVQQLLVPGFTAGVVARLVELGIAPHRLRLEITESQLMEQPQLTLDVLAELDAARVGISIDDFGVGSSSLAYVREVPASELKIDRLFVSGLPDNRKDRAVVAATVLLARSLGMRSVAEGVETAAQLAHLRQVGCDFAQGFLIGRPLPGAEIDLGRWVSQPPGRTP